ncbi:aminoglycoside phosphotransferase family protein [Nocardia sp. GCM10030253]|uniref:aminoglycoside phosphotransferase family protein n=1 Tax=Nocardia sp. GCM10030253 TaxID=3273404 RepID=UPI00363E32C4
MSTKLFSEDVDIKPMKSGVSSLNYLARNDSGEYVVRLDLFRNEGEVKTDFEIAELSKGYGVNAPAYAMWVGNMEGASVSVREYAHGRVLSAASQLDEGTFELCGLQLRNIHSAALPSKLRRPWFYATPLANFRSMKLPGDALIQKAVATLEVALAQLDPTSWKCGLVHTDFKFDNLVLNPDGIFVLDWEKATWAPVLFDLGLALFHITTDPDNKPGNVSAFIHGYGGEGDYSENFQQQLKAMTRVAASIFFLVDAEISLIEASKSQVSRLGTRHAEYFNTYCIPRYEIFLEQSS